MNFIKLYLSIFLIIKIKSQSEPESTCRYINNCFDCNAAKDNKCKWESYSCKKNEESSSNVGLIQRILFCYENKDKNTIDQINNITKEYCGELNKYLVKKDIKINLPEKDDEYGLPNLICRYTLTNSNIDKKYYIKIKKKIKSSPSIILNVTQQNDDNQILINEDDVTYHLNKPEIYIIVYTPQTYSKNPFDITISYNNSDNSKTIIIICIIIIKSI